VNEKISILPADEVGVGAFPPAHLKLGAETVTPPIWNVDGMRPVEPCVTNTLMVIILEAVVGTLVTLKVIASVGAVAM
jgi:hypothetical protein